MKRLSIALFVVASLVLLLFSGCSLQLEQLGQAPETEAGAMVGGDALSTTS
jgi:CHASE3 domain sensor protein